jgi:large subunit ribosomal protein L31
MKTDIHPNYQEITTTCSCGNVLPVMSTLKDNLSLDVCAKCHPFYTGKQKMLDSGGRVKKFQDRFGASGTSKPAAKKAEAKVEETAVEEVAEEVLETPVEEVVEETAAEVAEVEEAAEEETSEDNAEAETAVESDGESEEDK